MEATQGWRGAADALALCASRWDQLITDPVERSEEATYVHARTLDLYMIAGLLAELLDESWIDGHVKPLLVGLGNA